MIESMRIRTAVLFVVMTMTIVSAQNSSSTPTSMFGNVPQGNYSAGTAATVDTGSLQGIFDMAKGFVNVVFQPFAELAVFIEDIIAIFTNNSDEDFLKYLGDNWEEMAKFEAGYITCLVFGLLFIILVPLVGSIMCCCRCCGNCGGRLEQSTERSKSCWRQCLCCTMLILTSLMAVPTVFVFLNNEWITQVIDTGPAQVVAVLNDTTEYLNTVPAQITYVTDQYDTVDNNVRPLVDDLGKSVGVPYQQFVRSQSEASIQALGEAGKVQVEALAAIDSVDSSLTVLSTGMVVVDTSLTDLRTNMTVELDVGECRGDLNCTAVLVSISVLNVGFNVSAIAPLGNELTDVRTDLSAFNITDQQADLEKEIDEIPNTVRSQTQDASNSAVEALNSAQDSVDQVSTSLPTESLDDIENSVQDISKSITDAITVYDDNFDQYRYIAGLVLGSMLAFIVACYFLGLLLGVCGHDRKVSPGERGCSSNCGGIWLMVGVGFSFIFSWLLMILVVVLFTVGGHGERYGCQGLEEPDYEALALVEKVTNISLAAQLKLPPEAELTIISLLESCKENQAAYSALKLEYVYNITELLGNVTSQMTDLKSDLDNAVNDIDVSDIEIYTAQSQADLLALKTTEINTIDFNEYLRELGTGITQTDLTEYARFLRNEADVFGTTAVAAGLQAMVYAHADEVDRIQADEVAGLQNDYDSLKASIDELVVISSGLNTTIDNLDSALTAFNASIQTGSIPEIQRIADDLYDQVNGNVTEYTTWAAKQVEEEVGACLPVYTAYTTTVGVFCDYLIDTINGLWFSLGWCLFFLLPAAIVAMKLMKFFRRMSYDDGYEEDFVETLPPMIYLPGLASHRADNIRSWDEMEMRDYDAPANKQNGAYY